MTIPELHAAYFRLTGLDLRLDMARERSWFEWQKRGFTENDLRLVVGLIKSGIKAGNRHPGALKFRNLIECPDYFEEDLALARAKHRVRTFSPGKVQVLKATGRASEPPKQAARSAAEILASQNALKAMRDFRMSNQ